MTNQKSHGEDDQIKERKHLRFYRTLLQVKGIMQNWMEREDGN
ncbi:hypothetical protein NARC_10166 [Candidatus Nitrosocosmicus arcticus]|uniref:Uncharacterized protein n=1 Tax=Candidatus Nitrosocosmicus arcticus TaxID=2035267 RepID=A0A557SYS4_9ARCH|nr:hypothetical protein NARC_10166 [Candidatus Nitrosocosmicus arcticus]